jgi:UDP-N-acetylglucosamine:LPS N-acetylglucosamine transferase
MRGLKPFWSQNERVWVTDRKRDTEVIANQEKVYWLPYQGPRDWLTLLKNVPVTFRILLKEKPDMVITTGASIAINFAIAARILGMHFIFIESISRSEELSVSGRIAYPLANEFYVQWQELTVRYPKAIFKGRVTANTIRQRSLEASLSPSDAK